MTRVILKNEIGRFEVARSIILFVLDITGVVHVNLGYLKNEIGRFEVERSIILFVLDITGVVHVNLGYLKKSDGVT